MGEREFCIFFKENMRLKDCYKTNDTVQLLTAHEFVLIPKTDTLDLISSPENIRANMGVYAGLITIIIISLVLLYGLYRIIKRNV